MLIEGCSGGGGRFDAGMLYYTPQIWTSDDTDSIERLKIQYGTSFCYPVSTMGAHVSASPNHQTGRAASLSTRATVAMAGTFGYELDPAKLTEEEKAEVRTQIETFKKYYSLIQDGTYYRLASPYENEEYTVWELPRRIRVRHCWALSPQNSLQTTSLPASDCAGWTRMPCTAWVTRPIWELPLWRQDSPCRYPKRNIRAGTCI